MMRLRSLGRSGLQVSELALGTVELGMAYGIPQPGEAPVPDEAEAALILQRAVDAGITLIDTARAYGLAEERIGRALGHRRHEIVLASKFTLVGPDRSVLRGDDLRRHFWASLEASLVALRTDHLDVYQVHAGADPAILGDGVIVELLSAAKAQGKIRLAGLSAYGVALPLAGLASGGFDVLQVAYNVLDRRMEAAVFPQAQAQGVGVIVRSALLKGALTERGDHLPDHLAPLREASQTFRRLARELPGRPTPVQAALRFCLAHPAVSAALIGVRSLPELDEARGLTAIPDLSPHVITQLETLALTDEELLNPGTWGIP